MVACNCSVLMYAFCWFAWWQTCGTLLDSGYFCRPSACGPFWTAKQIWDHYLGSVGIGWVNTLNAPPGTDGQIPAGLVANMASFGSALRALLIPVGNTTTSGKAQCGVDIVSAPPLVLELARKVSFDSVMIREDLSHGQRTSPSTSIRAVAAGACSLHVAVRCVYRALPVARPHRVLLFRILRHQALKRTALITLMMWRAAGGRSPRAQIRTSAYRMIGLEPSRLSRATCAALPSLE